MQSYTIISVTIVIGTIPVLLSIYRYSFVNTRVVRSPSIFGGERGDRGGGGGVRGGGDGGGVG